MRSQRTFAVVLTGFVLLYLCYGLKRFSLGIDFTDEGAYLAWPLRTLFGENLFSSEPAVLLRPLIGYLSILFKLHPTMTLYEFRMLGWCIHLGAFVVLAILLFRLSGSPLRSPLIASVPLFVCHILSVASPSYYSLSSDFLLIALSLGGLASIDGQKGKTALNCASGLALFLATMAHAALGVIGAIVVLREVLKRQLVQNIFRRKLAPSNARALAFFACWLVFFVHIVGSGQHTSWLHNIKLFRALTVNPLYHDSVGLVLRVVSYPFYYSRLGLLFSLSALGLGGALYYFHRTKRPNEAGTTAASLAFLLIASLICTFSYEIDFVVTCFAMVALVLIAIPCLEPIASPTPINPEIRFLMMLSGIAALLCATSSYYFSPLRSWCSGMLALPFAFAVGLTLLLRSKPSRSPALFSALTMTALFLLVACVVRDHYRNIHRDGPSLVELTDTFRAPKLRHIVSTRERVRVIDSLYDHLSPKLSRGEPFLTFDHTPMLYYLFDVMPAYGMTWAARYTQSEASLQALNREFKAKPLPRYAVRALVDISNPVWEISPRLSYDNYPLNETVLANYELERTIFPFEIWRLKSVAP